MHDKPVSLIAMDMDGTLLDSRQRLTPGNLAALRKAQAAGIHLAICSGRLPGDVAMFLDEAGLPDCAILSLNGAYCLKRCMEGEFFNHPLENATLEAAVAILRRARFPFGCFAQNRLAIFKGDFQVDDDFWGTYTCGRFAPQYLYGMAGLDALRAQGVNKLLCMARDEEKLERVRQALSALPGLDVTSSWSMNLELMPAGVNKGMAVAALAQKLGIGPESVMALGDYDNDVSMLSYAGVSVAMANASERARAAGAAQVEVTPEVPYRIRTSAGDVLPEDPDAPLPAEVPAGSRRGPDDESLENLKAAGLVHEGFDRGYSAVPRWRYVKDLTGIEDEDALIASYNKKAKRDVRTARASFVSVERIGRDELPTYHHICELSCEKQGFENRPLAYFEQLFDTLGDAAEFFVAYLDVPAYLSSWEQKRDALLADIERYEAAIAEIESDNQSGQGQYRSTKKVSRQMADAREKYESSLRRIDDARAALDAHGGTGRIPAAAALFVWHERECVYLFSGSDQSLAAFCAPTLVQHKIMCECVERGCSRYNFYGIDGIFDPTSPGYGLIEFKQSFNGYIEELLGSFTMPVRPAVLAAKRLAHKILGR